MMTRLVQSSPQIDAYVADCDRLVTAGAATEPSWLRNLRRQGIEHFADAGFPTTREEEWKFTSVAPIADRYFAPSQESQSGLVTELVESWAACGGFRLVLVNGAYAPQFSVGGLPTGVQVSSLRSILATNPAGVEPYLGRFAPPDRQAFTALNTSFLQDGAFVWIPPGTIIEQPISVLFVSCSPESASVSHPRTLIVAGDRSQVRIVEGYIGPPGQEYFTNAVTEVVVGSGALVDHYKLQRESQRAYHVGSMYVHGVRDSTFSSHSIAFGGALVRNDIIALLDGEGGDYTLNGLYLVDGQRLIDNHTTIDHAKPHCGSHELYKGILSGRARAVFNGKIIVRPDAQKTDAKQTNKALLLSDDAQINTKPQLEIFANDVKCTHGAAVGQLDEDAIFYLRARGLDLPQARDMLIFAFAGDVLNRIRIDGLRKSLEDHFLSELPAGGGAGTPAMTSIARIVAPSQAGFNVHRIREDFPALHQTVHGKPLVYLDNAATTQKPRAVLDALTAYYSEDNANVHRGVHLLSERATQAFEDARATVQHFINAVSTREIVFTRNATEGINLVAQTFGRTRLGPRDEVVISAMEHHSNIVPWQMVCEEKGASLRVIPITDEGVLQLDEYERLLGPHTRLVSIVHLSNVLGTINPVQQIIATAHRRGVPVLIDGSQAVHHLTVDVQALDADFYVFTGHKLYGPTGIGVLYGKERLLEAMPPYQGGGDMIKSVTFEKTTYNALPYKFEAGTPNIAGAIGLAAAVAYVTGIGMDRIAAHERELLAYGTAALSGVPGLTLIGTAAEKSSVLSFVMDGVHPHDIGTVVDQEGVAIRTGHHCAQPLMLRLGIPATARASLALYNTREEIDALVGALHKVRELFA